MGIAFGKEVYMAVHKDKQIHILKGLTQVLTVRCPDEKSARFGEDAFNSWDDKKKEEFVMSRRGDSSYRDI